MYCINCGNKVDGNNFCKQCGTKVENIYTNNVQEEKSGLKTASIVLGILGIVGALLCVFAPISLILSIVGLVLGIIASKKVKNVIGIVLNSIGIFLSIIMLVVIALLISFMVNYVSNVDMNIDENGNTFYDFFEGFEDDFGMFGDFGNIEDYFNDFFGEEGNYTEEYDGYYEKF